MIKDPVMNTLKMAARKQAINAVNSRNQVREYREALELSEKEAAQSLEQYTQYSKAIMERDPTTSTLTDLGLPWTRDGVDEETSK